MRKLLLCGLVCLLFLPVMAMADTLLDSRAGVSEFLCGSLLSPGQTCPSIPVSGTTVLVSPVNTAWAPAIGTSAWVSYNAGTGGPSTPTQATPNGDTMLVTDTFNTGGDNGITIDVLADDTTSVWLKGPTNVTPILSFDAASGNTFATCSDVEIGCLVATEGIFTISGLAENTTYTLKFGDEQINGSSFGLDYEVTGVPEPASILLFGSGLLGLAGMARRRFGK